LNSAEQLEKRLGRLLRNTNRELDPSVSDVTGTDNLQAESDEPASDRQHGRRLDYIPTWLLCIGLISNGGQRESPHVSYYFPFFSLVKDQRSRFLVDTRNDG
jgi:hypothetical protein